MPWRALWKTLITEIQNMIYHLTTHTAWQKTLDSGKEFYIAASLDTEGFIHCSYRDQVAESAKLHFEGEDELVLLHIVEKRIKEILKPELSRKGDVFPHVYGALPLEAIEEVYVLVREKDGKFHWG